MSITQQIEHSEFVIHQIQAGRMTCFGPGRSNSTELARHRDLLMYLLAEYQSIKAYRAE